MQLVTGRAFTSISTIYSPSILLPISSSSCRIRQGNAGCRLMSQASNLPNVRDKNERVLRKFGKSMHIPESYVDSVNKVAMWMRDPKAYYTEARPTILEIVEVAYERLRIALGISLDPVLIVNLETFRGRSDFADAYVLLIENLKANEGSFASGGTCSRSSEAEL
ncbi:hypothetical protein C8J56DRAFT_954999 [Mycena floridula]|nr:hypothetical protein C8J56DRAFT_954999 [Mycena floridula]